MKIKLPKLYEWQKNENYMKYWVYIHLFPNGKRYVGLTTQKSINKRWMNGWGYKKQKLIYNAILKYGWKNIKHIIYEVDTESEMKYLERYLIGYYNTTNRLYGYNISTGGESSIGVPSKKRKPIDQYDKQGNFIRTWESIYSVNYTLNYDVSSISKCLRKKYPTAYGCYWCYSGETPEFKTYRIHRKVYQYRLTGEFIAEFKNAREAAKSLGKSDNSTIVRCCNKQIKTAFNFIWKYES